MRAPARHSNRDSRRHQPHSTSFFFRIEIRIVHIIHPEFGKRKIRNPITRMHGRNTETKIIELERNTIFLGNKHCRWSCWQGIFFLCQRGDQRPFIRFLRLHITLNNGRKLGCRMIPIDIRELQELLRNRIVYVIISNHSCRRLISARGNGCTFSHSSP